LHLPGLKTTTTMRHEWEMQQTSRNHILYWSCGPTDRGKQTPQRIIKRSHRARKKIMKNHFFVVPKITPSH
jgi:hypothetical protein